MTFCIDFPIIYIRFVPISCGGNFFPSYAVVDLRGTLGMCPLPLWIQFLSFSYSFWGKLGQIIGFLPHLWGWCPPSGKFYIRHCYETEVISSNCKFIFVHLKSRGSNAGKSCHINTANEVYMKTE